MLIRIDTIDVNGNLRRTPATPEQDASLETSLRALGQAQPILVRPSEQPGYTHLLIAGRRRLEAMRAIGHEEIEALVISCGERIATALQGAENMVRAGMDPVDQWLAIRTLQDQGYELLQAGQALGLNDRHTRRLDRLSQLAPPLLDAMRGRPLPAEHILGVIAAAPHDRQVRALERHRLDDLVAWRSVADECVVTTIPRDRARFDVETAGVVFEEDLFAEPGTPEQFVTRDVQGFLAAQLQAVETLVASRAEPALIQAYQRVSTLPEIPKGWVIADNGAGSKRLPPKGKRKRAYAIVPAIEGDRAGTVVSVVIEPIAKPAAPAAKTQQDAVPAAADEDTAPEAEAPVPEEPDTGIGITKLGQQKLAQARTEALRAALSAPGTDVAEMLALMVLSCCAENGLGGGTWVGGNGGYDDLAAALLTPSGEIAMPDDETLVRIAAEALSRILTIRSAADHQAIGKRGSGAAAEWIGRALQADTCMPPLDVPEFLECVNATKLREIAARNGVGGSTKAAELRKKLAGHAPNINPIPFGAPAPAVEPWQARQETEK